MRTLALLLAVSLLGCAGTSTAPDGGASDTGAIDAAPSDDAPSDAPADDAAPAPDVALDVDAAALGRPFVGWQMFPDASDGAWIYVPTTGTAPLPALVMLHGCTQTARDFADATRAEAFAEANGVVMLFPQQSLAANPQRCWSWFSADEQAGTGPEITRIAMHVASLPTTAAVDASRVFVAGLSAGAAMTSIVGATHPELVSGLAVHSGLAYGSATTLTGAFMAQASGDPDVPASSEGAYRAMGAHARTLPVIVFHGTADTVVAPINGAQVAAAWRGTDDWIDDGAANGSIPAPTTRMDMLGGRNVTIETVTRADGVVLVERWAIEGVGHAWSGGAPGQPFTAPGPDALAALWTFFGR
jgi:poly(hydroxyalkanoate) depolymerase family esterase